jgi:hypothetical protein
MNAAAKKLLYSGLLLIKYQVGSAGSASSIGTHEFLIIDEQIRLQTLVWMVVMLALWICMAAR